MKLLLDTQLLLWAAAAGDDEAFETRRLSAEAVDLIDDEANELYFSAVSIWEVAIKSGLGRPSFRVDPYLLRRSLLDNEFVELTISAEHTAGVIRLPALHKDPFDRLLVSQASSEGLTLVTADAKLNAYPGPIRRV